MDNNFNLDQAELLSLHQLAIAQYWSHKNEQKTENAEICNTECPHMWEMTQGVTLYNWQQQCIDKYNGSGIVKVVTGAGKTMFALAAVEKMQNSHPDLKVLIVVPTIVLMNQWYDVICKHSNLPSSAIGRLGGGFANSLSDCSILIGVCNSVASSAASIGSKYAGNLFFIADECHMYTGEVMRKVFGIRRKYVLGLSATPDSGNDAVVPEVITEALGDIFYTLNYDDAVKSGFLPEFEICHIGLPLDVQETTAYDKLSREITDLRNELLDRFPDAPHGGDLTGWAAMMLKKNTLEDNSSSVCGQYIAKVAERKDLIYHAKNREKAVIRFLKERMLKKGDTQVIIFHERIQEVMRLYRLLLNEGIAAVPEHSELSDSLRTNSIELFRQGIAKVIVSGKALIQGFDAPAADCGISTAASGSPTQAIQSIGRILRKNGDDQTGLILRFYMCGTTDENIYRKMNFSTITGAKRNRYFLWDPSDEKMDIFAQEQPAPPQLPKPENGIIWNNVKPGELLDFDADGEDFQIDRANNFFKKNGRKKLFVVNQQNLLEILQPFRNKMRNSYIRQTSSGRIFLLQECGENWRWLYCGKLSGQLAFEEAAAAASKSSVESEIEEFQIKQFRGQVIIQQKKFVNNRKLSIRPPLDEEIFSGLKRISDKVSCEIKEIFIVGKTNVFCRIANQQHHICTLSNQWDQ
jgi:superfamily II DNA or RNA helicase